MNNPAKKYGTINSPGGECAIATVAGITDDIVWLEDDGIEEAYPADRLESLGKGRRLAIGDVVLTVMPVNRDRPVIVDRVETRNNERTNATPAATTAKVDGKQVRVVAHHEIVLECGEASITLTRDGKITLRGTRVVSRASGVNKIKGGSIQIN